MRLEFSTTFHPQTDGLTERVNQILEDMLRACALDYGSSWDDNLPCAEFSYNNSYQSSVKMAPFEALYRRRCRTPLMWDEVGDRQLFGPDLIKESEEKVNLIRNRLKVAQSRQKSYADTKCKEVVYEIRDTTYLRVSPLRGVKRFGVKGKLAPRFVRPYCVLERMGEVAYKLELPEGLSGVHDVFHVSKLKMYHAEMADIPLRDTVPLEAIQLDFAKLDNLTAGNSAGILKNLNWFLLIGQITFQLNRFQQHGISQRYLSHLCVAPLSIGRRGTHRELLTIPQVIPTCRQPLPYVSKLCMVLQNVALTFP